VIEESEMKRRLDELLQRVRYFKSHEPAEMLTMEYLFYGDREENEEECGESGV
jgi:hypothetical protein